MQKYNFSMKWQKYFVMSGKVCIFAPSLSREMTLTVEELNCLTNHHLEVDSSIICNIGFLRFL